MFYSRTAALHQLFFYHDQLFFNSVAQNDSSALPKFAEVLQEYALALAASI